MKRGIFNEKQLRKIELEDKERERRKLKKVRDIQIECNHIDTEGKDKLKPHGNGTLKCKLCKAVIIADSNVVNPESTQEAMDLLLSAVAIARHELNLTEKYDAKLVDACKVLADLPEILSELIEQVKDKKDKKKDKRHDNKNNKKNKRSRIRY